MMKRATKRSVQILLFATMASISAVTYADPPAGRSFVAEPSGGEVTYHLVHKLHRVEGHCKAVSGRASLDAEGKLRVAITAQAAAFDSGNANRDAHMKEVVEAARYPTIEVRAIATNVQLPDATTTVHVMAKAQVDFHGVKKVLEVPVDLTSTSDGRMRAVSHFPVSLDEYKVERPSLFFVKVDDSVQIDAVLSFREDSR